MPKFDRIASFDTRSLGFPVRALVGDKPLRSYTWSVGIVLDQGSEGACTGFAVAHELAARPVRVPGVDNAMARRLYKRAQQIDEWPGESYEGSSVLAAVKAAAEQGRYAEYRWAFSEQDLALAIGYKGPAILGVNWHQGMVAPDADGFVAPTGPALGGHAILCNAISIRGDYYTLHNSWGPSWGKAGTAKIRRADLAQLLARDGEACIPVVRA